METIGNRLKELRLKKGKTLTEVAETIGVSQSALSNYENDVRIPRDQIKKKIAEYYKRSVSSIFFK